jgi:2-desacetyl-2-hydroxyethyl bacteriochlorophyllide A dehydrogenase
MKAAVLSSAGHVRIDSVPDPKPAPREVVVEVQACGICATDVHIFDGDFVSRYPLVPGHELSGVVVEVGSQVKDIAGAAGQLKVGDRVAVDPSVYCLDCHYCRTNRGNHCERWNAYGVTLSGGFAEYIAVQARNVFKVENLTPTQAAFIEPISCCVYGLRRLALREGDEVLVVGSGAIGLQLGQLLRRGGAARVVMLDPREERLQLAGKLGLPDTVLADGNAEARLRAVAPFGFDAVVDASGNARAVEGMFRHLKPTGKALFFGVCAKDDTIKLSPFDVYKNDWTILGSFALCYTFDPAVRLLEGGVLDVEPLVSHRLPLDDFPAALEMLRRGEGVKLQIIPRE